MNITRILIKSNVMCTKRHVSNQLIVDVFDRRTKLMQKNLSALNVNYKDSEYLKEETGYRVADRIFDIKRTFNHILDMGSSRGYVSRHLTKETVKKITLLESSELLLNQVVLPEDGIQVNKLHHDEEQGLPFNDNEFDLIVSNLSMHWINNLPKLFQNVLRCLKKDGAFIGSMFAGDTLYELRVSLQLAELERTGGLSAHISPMTTAQDIGSLLSSSGFNMLTLDLDDIIIQYPSLFELIYDLRDMGESNCAWNRSLNLSVDKLLAAQAIYKEMYGNQEDSQGIPATYQILYFIAWKPDDSQAKPARRGSGEVSLKDLGSIDEILKKKK